MPVDGHFMHCSSRVEVYAATRAWRWQHEFKEVKLAATATAQVAELAAADEVRTSKAPTVEVRVKMGTERKKI